MFTPEEKLGEASPTETEPVAAASVDLTKLDSACHYVETVFEDLARLEGIVPRPSQVEMAKQVACGILRQEPLAVEAPTGTGKTLAYLIGGLAAVREGAPGLTISTSTKALQGQLLADDAPKLIRAGHLTPKDLITLKGRQNYVCTRILDELAQGVLDPQENLVVQTAEVDMEPEDVLAMLHLLREGKWDGDFDTLDRPFKGKLTDISAKVKTCSGKLCDNYAECPYYLKEAAAVQTKLVVTNHDFLLSVTLSNGTWMGHSRVILDEAHHFPEKAMGHLTQELNLPELLRSLSELLVLRPVYDRLRQPRGFDDLQTDEIAELARTTLDELKVEFPAGDDDVLAAEALDGGKIPTLPQLHAQLKLATSAVRALRQSVSQDKDLVWRVYLALKVLEPAELASFSLLNRKSWIRWADKGQVLRCAPSNVGRELRDRMWPELSKSVTMVSATLKAMGGFSEFLAKMGQEYANTLELPYVLPYAKSTLRVVMMDASPKQAERKAYEAELSRKLPAAIDVREGSLVLFSSWRLLERMRPLLQRAFGSAVRFQGDKQVKLLVQDHKAAVDAGQGSILVGLGSLAEGLDLPGKYCTHVLINALPFSVPTSAVEKEMQKRMGPSYFERRALPEAHRKLTQACGRLVRRESDKGRITIFDKRLATMPYGKRMLKELPPFQVVSI